MEPIKTNKLILQCDCHGMEFMQFLKFEDDGDEDSRNIYVTFGGCEMGRFKRRLEAAWRLIRYGEYQNDGILLFEEKDKLITWLQNIKQ